jgi:HKD family nuclease
MKSKAKYINFKILAADYQTVSREAAFKEIKRENEMREKKYDEWANQQFNKLAAFNRQYKSSSAIQKVISVMTDREWAELQKRIERKMEESKQQLGLF